MRNLYPETNERTDIINSEDNFNDPNYNPNFALSVYNDGQEPRKTAAKFIGEGD